MILDSETNRPLDEKERIKLLNLLIKERFGDWAVNKSRVENEDKNLNQK